jgi:UDP-N-acetylmuramyl pentapeptide synthase
LAAALLRIRPWHRHAVIEVGIGDPGEMEGFAAMIRPNVTVVTAIGSDHLNKLGSLEVTRHEKAYMVRALPPDGLAVLNGDDPNVLWMRDQTRARVLTFGFGEGNEVRASEVRLNWPHGTVFTLEAAGQRRVVQIRPLGRHQVYPALAAVAVSLEEGVALDEVIERLESVPPIRSRLSLVRLTNGAMLIRDDYKSPLESVEAALDLLEEIPAERKFVVLGEMKNPPGDRLAVYHRLGGRIAQVASRAIFVGRQGQDYLDGARQAAGPEGTSRQVDAGPGLRRAVELLREELLPGDVVLVKGWGKQRLDRISLALMGRKVRCARELCHLGMSCDGCLLLSRGSKPPL